ncbi:Hypothetical protein CAP_3162 [Chondromyces apiculatus DSM 436]|uniref:Uncharacterized protein n=1 Tax=Chondromyces apiculatus DSM 436 TaxID=1192034 RepID=A0A017T8R5_9BACT|nr:Hypothetical protein CAP_3162 [Chondromyces apiculatus DSM 436]
MASSSDPCGSWAGLEGRPEGTAPGSPAAASSARRVLADLTTRRAFGRSGSSPSAPWPSALV